MSQRKSTKAFTSTMLDSSSNGFNDSNVIMALFHKTNNRVRRLFHSEEPEEEDNLQAHSNHGIYLQDKSIAETEQQKEEEEEEDNHALADVQQEVEQNNEQQEESDSGDDLDNQNAMVGDQARKLARVEAMKSLHMKNLSPVSIVAGNLEDINEPIAFRQPMSRPSLHQQNHQRPTNTSLRRTLFTANNNAKPAGDEENHLFCSTPMVPNRHRSPFFNINDNTPGAAFSPIRALPNEPPRFGSDLPIPEINDLLVHDDLEEFFNIPPVPAVPTPAADPVASSCAAEPSSPRQPALKVRSFARLEDDLRLQYNFGEKTPPRRRKSVYSDHPPPSCARSFRSEPGSALKACSVVLERMDVDSSATQKQHRTVVPQNMTDFNSMQMVETPIHRIPKANSLLAAKLRQCETDYETEDEPMGSDLTEDENVIIESTTAIGKKNSKPQKSQKKPARESTNHIAKDASAKPQKKNQSHRAQKLPAESELTEDQDADPLRNTKQKKGGSAQPARTSRRTVLESDATSDQAPKRNEKPQKKAKSVQPKTPVRIRNAIESSDENEPGPSTKQKNGGSAQPTRTSRQNSATVSESDTTSDQAPKRNEKSQKKAKSVQPKTSVRIRNESYDESEPGPSQTLQNKNNLAQERTTSNRQLPNAVTSESSPLHTKQSQFRKPKTPVPAEFDSSDDSDNDNEPAPIPNDQPAVAQLEASMNASSDSSIRRVVPNDIIKSFRNMPKRRSRDYEGEPRDSMRINAPPKTKKKKKNDDPPSKRYLELTKPKARATKRKGKASTEVSKKRTLYSELTDDEVTSSNIVSSTQDTGAQSQTNTQSSDGEDDQQFVVEALPAVGREAEVLAAETNEEEELDDEMLPAIGKKNAKNKAQSKDDDASGKRKRQTQKKFKRIRKPSKDSDDSDESEDEGIETEEYDNIKYDPVERGCLRPGLRVRRFATPAWDYGPDAGSYGLVYGAYSYEEAQMETKFKKELRLAGITEKQLIKTEYQRHMSYKHKREYLRSIVNQSKRTGESVKKIVGVRPRAIKNPASIQQRAVSEAATESHSLQSDADSFASLIAKVKAAKPGTQSETTVKLVSNESYDMAVLESIGFNDCGHGVFFAPLNAGNGDGLIKLSAGITKPAARASKSELKFFLLSGAMILTINSKTEIHMKPFTYINVKVGTRYQLANKSDADSVVLFVRLEDN